MAEEVILPGDPRAATWKTVSGWVSRDGRFYGGEERAARYAGSTHAICYTCGVTCRKGYTKCEKCIEACKDEQWAKMERREWDGAQMLYSQTADGWFASPDEALDWMADDEERPQTLEEMRLVLGDPVGVRPLDGSYCADQLADDCEEPKEVAEAMDAFNRAVSGIVLSWRPGKYAWKIDGVAE